MSHITAQPIQSYFIYLWMEENQFEKISRAVLVSWCLAAPPPLYVKLGGSFQVKQL